MRMTHILKIGWMFCLAVGIGFIVSSCILYPDEGFSGEVVPNVHPSVHITGGVLEEGIDADARIRFYWNGSDQDGVVRWFEWAIDDTVCEGAWHRTTQFNETISFPATANSGDNTIFTDWHTFYVRSVDDAFQRSASDKRFFNAVTIAPVTTITQPEATNDNRWASTLKISWLGVDSDGSRADNLPSRYELKLCKVPGSIPINDHEAIMNVFADSTNLLRAKPLRSDYPLEDSEIYDQARRQWLSIPGTTQEYVIEGMEVFDRYGFIIKAIDEAGAEEQEFERNHNYVIFRVEDKHVKVVLFEPALGNRTYNTGDWPLEPWDVTVAPGQPIRFGWIGDASLSGTEPGKTNYGFDVPDPDDESFRSIDGVGGYIGWANRTRMQAPVSFSADGPSTHNFYLKMRDVSDKLSTETRCHVIIHVADFSFDRPFLVVDDLRYAPKPCVGSLLGDDETDYWRLHFDQETQTYGGVLSGLYDFMLPTDELHFYSVYRDNEASLQPDIDSEFLEVLGRYQSVIWDCGHDQPAGLRDAAGVNQYLSAYIGLGGNMFLYTFIGPAQVITNKFGFDAPTALCPRENDFSTPGYYWNALGFLWQFLNMTGCVDKPRGSTTQGNLDESLVAAIADNPIYPDLYLDSVRWPCDNGIMNYEALVSNSTDPDVIPWYELQDGLDIIYRAQTKVTTYQSDLQDKPIAWRTYPVEGEQTDRGRIMCWSFHPYFFQEDEVEIAMTYALHWLVNGSDY